MSALLFSFPGLGEPVTSPRRKSMSVSSGSTDSTRNAHGYCCQTSIGKTRPVFDAAPSGVFLFLRHSIRFIIILWLLHDLSLFVSINPDDFPPPFLPSRGGSWNSCLVLAVSPSRVSLSFFFIKRTPTLLFFPSPYLLFSFVSLYLVSLPPSRIAKRQAGSLAFFGVLPPPPSIERFVPEFRSEGRFFVIAARVGRYCSFLLNSFPHARKRTAPFSSSSEVIFRPI